MIAVAAIALAIMNGPALRNVDLAGAFAQAVVPSLALWVVGRLIASRRPDNHIRGLLLAGATGTALQGFASEYVVHTQVVSKESLPGAEWVAWLGSTFGSP